MWKQVILYTLSQAINYILNVQQTSNTYRSQSKAFTFGLHQEDTVLWCIYIKSKVLARGFKIVFRLMEIPSSSHEILYILRTKSYFVVLPDWKFCHSMIVYCSPNVLYFPVSVFCSLSSSVSVQSILRLNKWQHYLIFLDGGRVMCNPQPICPVGETDHLPKDPSVCWRFSLNSELM